MLHCISIVVPIKSEKIDLFLGCALGLAKNDLTVTMSSNQNTSIFTGVFQDFKLPGTIYFAPTFGLRFFLAKNVGVNIEMGYDQGALALAGLFVRFRPMKYKFPNK